MIAFATRACQKHGGDPLPLDREHFRLISGRWFSKTCRACEAVALCANRDAWQAARSRDLLAQEFIVCTKHGGDPLPAAEFGMVDGRRRKWCRSCCREHSREWRMSKRGRAARRAYVRERRDAGDLKPRPRRESDPVAAKARLAAAAAIKSGVIARASRCERCSGPADRSRRGRMKVFFRRGHLHPLDVAQVCAPCWWIVDQERQRGRVDQERLAAVKLTERYGIDVATAQRLACPPDEFEHLRAGAEARLAADEREVATALEEALRRVGLAFGERRPTMDERNLLGALGWQEDAA